MLRLEDRTLSGVTKDLDDGGGRTRFGITEKSNPEATDVFYSDDTATALEFAKDLYWRKYWQPIQGALIASDELAATLLSFAVNDGVERAVKELQSVLGVAVDGSLGPHTLSALGFCNASDVAVKLREVQELFYEGVVARNPAMTKNMKGWMRRASAMYPDLPA